ncbi:MAG: YchJ family protein [Bdellovibrionales bacterium]
MSNEKCPCESGLDFSLCCHPFLAGERQAPTAEALMRSRYSAFVKGEVGYIKSTLAPESRQDFDEKEAKAWSASADWRGLKILSTKKGKEADKKGTVEFVATYKQDGKTLEHHEVSEFRKNASGAWLFVDGESHTHEEGQGHDHHHHHPVRETVVRESPKVGRNDPCPCGSGKKYKKCCGA